ncbi:TonB-dependent receptor [Nitrosomonadales bacterium]|nr:TonB-dependent receptor [Nitrosomonadales bacterium]
MLNKIIALLLVCLVTQINAETKIDTEEIIVRNYQYDSKESTSPYSIEIHTAKEISVSGSTSIQSYLSQHSSLNISPNFGDRSKASIDMRGYGSETGYQNIVISIDGQRINNIDMSAQLLGQIDINSIDRIEIVKGTGSVSYGDGAMAGVINIYTKKYSGFSLESSIGSSGLKKNILNAGFTHKKFNLSFSAVDDKSEGHSARDLKGNKDRFKNKTQTVKLFVNAKKDTKLKFDVSSSRINQFVVGPIEHSEFYDDPKQNSLNTYNNYDIDNDRYGLGIKHKFNDKLNLNTDLYYEDKTYNALNAAGDIYDKGYFGANFIANYIGEVYSLKGGLQYFDGERKSVTIWPGKTSKQNISFFMESNFQPKGLSDKFLFSAGIRREKVNYRHVDTAAIHKTDELLTAWDLGVNYAVNSKLSIFSNINHGFQAPDIDRFFVSVWDSSPPFAWLRRDFKGFMKASKVNTLNVGLNNITDRNKFKVTTFYSDVKNEFVLDNSTFINQNLDNSKKYGVEIQNKFKLNDKTNANVLYNFIKAKIGKDNNSSKFIDGNDMPGVPNHTLVLNLDHKFSGQGTINISHTWKDEAYAMLDWENDNIQKQPYYSSTDLNINYNIRNQNAFNKLSVFGSIQNIFEHKNALVVGNDNYYPFNFKRTWVTGLKIDF